VVKLKLARISHFLVDARLLLARAKTLDPTYAEPFVPRVKLDERKQFYRKEMYP